MEHILVEEGGKVLLQYPCAVTFPNWRGPPNLTQYTNIDDASGVINPAVPAANRIQYASNNRDLILSNAVKDDSGDYQCTYPGEGTHTITLKVHSDETRCIDEPDAGAAGLGKKILQELVKIGVKTAAKETAKTYLEKGEEDSQDEKEETGRPDIGDENEICDKLAFATGPF